MAAGYLPPENEPTSRVRPTKDGLWGVNVWATSWDGSAYLHRRFVYRSRGAAREAKVEHRNYVRTEPYLGPDL